MPDVYGPFTTATWGQAPWFRDKGPLEPSGVAGPPAATAGAGELGLTTAGLTGTLALGRAHVRGAGYERTATGWAYAHPANTNPTLARIDRYVIRRDLAAGTVVPAVLQGTPAATPAAVPVTQLEDSTWELPLFQVNVPANSGTGMTIVADERVYVPQVRQHPVNGLELWNGTTWAAPVASQWVEILRNNTYSATVAVGGAYISLPSLDVTLTGLPPGREVEVEFKAPKLLQATAPSTALLRLAVGGTVADNIEYQVPTGVTYNNAARMTGSGVVGVGGTLLVQVQGRAVASTFQVTCGTDGAVVFRYRVR